MLTLGLTGLSADQFETALGHYVWDDPLVRQTQRVHIQIILHLKKPVRNNIPLAVMIDCKGKRKVTIYNGQIAAI